MTMTLPKGSIMVWRKGTIVSQTDGVLTVNAPSGGGTLVNWTELTTKIFNADTESYVNEVIVPSEHSRAPLAIDTERVENSKRMANARLRKYVVADKRTWSTSWEGLPYESSKTVDGMAGVDVMQEFYDTTPGSFILTVVRGGAKQAAVGGDMSLLKHYQVMFQEFTPNISKRGYADKGDLSVSVVEV